MKVCIFGAGSIGGLIGARLGISGCQISAIARGPTLSALQQHGLRLQQHGMTITTVPVCATHKPATLGPQDLVVIAVKGPNLIDVAARISPLIGPQTTVLTAMNGIPWWFFDGLVGSYSGMKLRTLDPEGVLDVAIPTKCVIGCVIFPNCSIVEPGLVQHNFGNKLIVGEPGGQKSPRIRNIVDHLVRAKFEVQISDCIQKDIWNKLLGNMTHNPISALTGATCDHILDDPLVNRFCVATMAEATVIGGKIGCFPSQSGEECNANIRKLGAFKTSMLQDVETGKPIEIDILLSSVREIGQMVNEPTPNIDALLGLTRLFGRMRGLYH